MMYLKINTDETIVYPYTIHELKNEYPNTSFPEVITNDLLNSYNIHLVYSTSKGNDYTKNYTEGIPHLVDGLYFQSWIVSNATQEEINIRLENKWNEVRRVRNQYLSECDWTQLSDSPLTIENKQEWIAYRQSLRDITLQDDPFNIIWPIKP